MRLVRFNGGRVGFLLAGDVVYDVTARESIDVGAWPPVAMTSLIRRYADAPEKLADGLDTLPTKSLRDLRLDCPVDWPNKIVAFPANYYAHIAEMGNTRSGLISEFPANAQGFFLKSNSSLSGPEDPIVIPNLPNREIHHECELAIIIGRGGRNIPPNEAWRHIFGYSALLDLVVRGREERVMRKSFDTFCPVGPWITLASEVPDPNDITLELYVNGQLRQHANTSDLIVSIDHMIGMASSVMTLYPGDVIATGTPAGVGPLVAGDRVRSAVEGVGMLDLVVVSSNTGNHPVWNKSQSE